MKHLLRFLILSALCFASVRVSAEVYTNAVEQTAAWIAPTAPTSNEVRFARLLVRSTVKGDERVLVASAWAVAQTSQMSNKIPRGQAKDRGWPDDVDFTLEDFSLITIALEQNQSVFLCSAKDYSTELKQTRKSYTTADALAVWVDEIAPFGIKDTDLLSNEEAALLPRAE